MSLTLLLEVFPDGGDWVANSSCADDALALSMVSTAAKAALSRPSVWFRYLFGSPTMLARPILNDPRAALVFAHAHENHFRAAVAALRGPGWLQRYPTMKKRLVAGMLQEPKMGDKVFYALCERSRSPPSTPKRGKHEHESTPPKKKYRMDDFREKLQAIEERANGKDVKDEDDLPPLRKTIDEEQKRRQRLGGQLPLVKTAAQSRLDEIRARVIAKSQVV